MADQTPLVAYWVYIRRGNLVNTDPQKRCYDGCHFSYRIDWDEWKPWMEYPTREHAEKAVPLFSRDTQQLKVVEVPIRSSSRN